MFSSTPLLLIQSRILSLNNINEVFLSIFFGISHIFMSTNFTKSFDYLYFKASRVCVKVESLGYQKNCSWSFPSPLNTHSCWCFISSSLQPGSISGRFFFFSPAHFFFFFNCLLADSSSLPGLRLWGQPSGLQLWGQTPNVLGQKPNSKNSIQSLHSHIWGLCPKLQPPPQHTHLHTNAKQFSQIFPNLDVFLL